MKTEIYSCLFEEGPEVLCNIVGVVTLMGKKMGNQEIMPWEWVRGWIPVWGRVLYVYEV